MPKERNPNREKAFKLYKEHHGDITFKEIAEILSEKERNIKFWKVNDKWDKRYNPAGGAPIGNRNAVGNNGGPPEKNQNARTEGWYSKYYPTKVRNIIKETEEAGGSPIDILWAQIITQWANIVNAQKIMYVKNHNDLTRELKKTKVQSDYVGPKGAKTFEEVYREEEYELQFAWDKQATLLNSQSRAMGTLSNMIKRYEEMLKDGLATEEQKLRIKKIKVSINTNKDEFKNRKKIAKEKLQLEKDRFKHQKEMDNKNNW